MTTMAISFNRRAYVRLSTDPICGGYTQLLWAFSVPDSFARRPHQINLSCNRDETGRFSSARRISAANSVESASDNGSSTAGEEGPNRIMAILTLHIYNGILLRCKCSLWFYDANTTSHGYTQKCRDSSKIDYSLEREWATLISLSICV